MGNNDPNPNPNRTHIHNVSNRIGTPVNRFGLQTTVINMGTYIPIRRIYYKINFFYFMIIKKNKYIFFIYTKSEKERGKIK